MSTNENLVLYKQRIQKEIESLDPSLRDEYLEYEYNTYKREHLANHPDSWANMRLFFECDRRRDEKMKNAIDNAIAKSQVSWKDTPFKDKVATYFVGFVLLSIIVLVAL